jgi:thioredoxin reductase
VITEVAIIGGGPAGIAIAIQLKRYRIEPLLFEKDVLGGLLKNAWRVENYIGFPEGKSGLELVELFKKHLQLYNINVIFEKVLLLEYLEREGVFLLNTPRTSYYSKLVAVASGTKPKTLELIEELPKEISERIFYEIYPIMDEKNKKIAIIGAGDAAFDYALNLSRFNQVVIINRGEQIRALPILSEMVLHHPQITYMENSSVKRIEKGKEKGLLLTFTTNAGSFSIEADYLVIGIGRVPQKDFYSSKLIKMEEELLSLGLLYLVGDVKGGIYRQTSISVGDGIHTAMRIYQKLRR